jgi:hypothetical protein
MPTQPDDVLKMLVQLTELTQKLEQMGSTKAPAQQPGQQVQAPSQQPAPSQGAPVPRPALTPAHGLPAVGSTGMAPRTLEELMVGLSERLEQFASQTEERGRRLEARLERIEQLLEKQTKG